jgi:NAD(P)-dependent dehydrogenase (short-subunit alcohol dehydrogenase family)
MTEAFAENILEGKVAFICGGTRGMNFEIAKRYAEHGAKVAVMSRDEERTQKAASALREIAPDALGLSGDARDYERVEAITKEIADKFGRIDIVVAGQAGNFYAPAMGMSSKGFRTVIEIDLIGTYNVFRASFEHLVQPGASLIAITAPEAVRPLKYQSHVCAAKAGVNMLCKCLAIEWGPMGIRVNGISPGPIEDSWGMMNVISPTEELREQIRNAVPLKRWGTTKDVANTALFLASESASYITGTIIDTDGGVTINTPDPQDAAAESDPRLQRSKTK